MYGSAEQDIQFSTSIPVNLTYQTAFVDDAGQLQTRHDIYGMDSRMLNAIKSERGMIEIAQEPPRERRERTATAATTVAPLRAQPTRRLGFFESLFGGGGSNGRLTPPNRIR